MELLRQGYTVTVGRVENREVDFVAKKGNGKLYVQVVYLLANPETIEREFGPLARITDNYPKYVVSMDGIRHMNVRTFLLSFYVDHPPKS
jgi:predicted AAA+ superfamily ATPase